MVASAVNSAAVEVEGSEFLFTMTISPTALTNWCGMTTPRAPPNILKNEEPTLIFHPSILFSVRFTSSTCPKKSPSEVNTFFPTISEIFFILSMGENVEISIYTLCLLERCYKEMPTFIKSLVVCLGWKGLKWPMLLLQLF